MTVLRRLVLLASVCTLLGCATPPSQPRSYIVLLPSPDGTVGAVVVQNSKGEQALSQVQKGLPLDGSQPMFDLDQAKVRSDFDAAVMARPELPEKFVLFFDLGTTALTVESRALLPRVLDRIKERGKTSADLSIVGHTDTLDKAAANEVLGMRRANVIATQLKQLGLGNVIYTVESLGQRNQLVPTAAGVAEPRNRRVEITLR
jgi:outer membrane protein OmpA-like peptidoglycan-associated protein